MIERDTEETEDVKVSMAGDINGPNTEDEILELICEKYEILPRHTQSPTHSADRTGSRTLADLSINNP